MNGNFHDLRQTIFNLRKRIVPKQTIKKQPINKGLPEGIDWDTLNSVFQSRFEDRPATISFQHLSGWKSAGAFRLFITTEKGKATSLIFKNSLYKQEEIPALMDLPVCPGLAEFAIYSQPEGELKKYLPEVFFAEEVTPKEHYRYLLEDLQQGYRHIFNVEDIVFGSTLLPRLHQALQAWAAKTKQNGLLIYDCDFSQALDNYARKNLEAYQAQSDDPFLRETLSQWPGITQMHLRQEFFACQSQIPIHGDTNYTNIHLSKADPNDFKVVDWEWAGFGSRYADLASLIKGTSPEIENRIFQNYFDGSNKMAECIDGPYSSVESKRLYLWSQMERGILDAAFLASQHLNSSEKTEFSYPRAITLSLKRLLTAYQQLSN